MKVIPRFQKLLCILLLLCISLVQSVSAQDGRIWVDKTETPSMLKAARQIVPQKYRTTALDMNALIVILNKAPLQAQGITAKSSGIIIPLPLPDGTIARFSIVESPVMEPGLAAKFPEIKTYLGQGVDDALMSVRFDVTPKGFHAMIFTTEGTVFIDPYSKGDVVHYISYYKKDFIPPPGKIMQEYLPEGEMMNSIPQNSNQLRASGNQLRTYRVAIAADSNYYNFQGRTVAGTLAAIVTSLNRVNFVYEREVAIHMNLVNNNNLLIFSGATSPYPYTQTLACALRPENQTKIDAVIGSANYDIGHLFAMSAGGCATGNSVCNNSLKAYGVTGTGNPVGDPFDIDYVAHEMGHQFNAGHTWNGTQNSCTAGQHDATSSYEPGSGTTIMAYAGICASDNLQPNSDPYFHTRSFDAIVAYSTSGTGSSCGQTSSTGNSAPSVNAGPSYTIPKSTPFILTGSATDPEGDPLTFCWEEFDLGPAGPPNVSTTTGPIFRSFNPKTSPSRTFPKLSDILSNTTTIGEILPSIGRTMVFRLTARDNRAGGGGVDYASTNVVVDAASGPFAVTAPNTAVTWCPGAQTVTWDVANTNVAPVNVANVNILLSTDGGLTFPISLAANTPNDGSQSVTIPCVKSTTARIKVEAAGNIFFDISDVNFTTGDNTKPTFTVPADIIINKDANCNYDASVAITGDVTDEADNCSTGLNATSTDVTTAGSCVGETVITRTWTLTDGCGNSTVKDQIIKITDITPPTFTAPPNATIYKDANCNYNAATSVTGDVTDEADNCDNTLEATYTDAVANGSCMGEQVITRTWSLTDDCGNSTSHIQVITARDTTRPAFSNVAPSKLYLWPPNHKMQPVAINYTVTDNCSDAAHITSVLAVSSNEPINGTGDGDTDPDWQIVDNHNVILRAERAGNGSGRVYTITITSTDDCGNVAVTSTTVMVVHNITGPISGRPFRVGSTVAFSGNFWDRSGNTHTARWILDDNIQATGTVAEPSATSRNGVATGSYRFNASGVYRVQMNITDQQGVTSYATSNGDLEEIVVIYDPNGGYTFGGGWYHSAPGALTGSQAEGKTSFGFAVNRFKNATLPKGETQFKFQVGNFEFNAVNFDYMVIAGAKAQIKGSGKITGGQSGVGFILTVLDSSSSVTGKSRIRMKIFNRNTGYVYYDDQRGTSDASNPVTQVGTNSTIVVMSDGTTRTDGTQIAKQQPVQLSNEDLSVRAMPNPAQGYFNIFISSEQKSERIFLKVYDLAGNLIEQRMVANSAMVRIGESYKTGTYILKAQQGKRSVEVKLLKIN